MSDFWIDVATKLREDETRRTVEQQYWVSQLPAKSRRPSRWRTLLNSIMGLFL